MRRAEVRLESEGGFQLIRGFFESLFVGQSEGDFD
jgi:hypothetical protein